MAKLQVFYDKFAALDGVKEYLGARPTVWGMPAALPSRQKLRHPSLYIYPRRRK